MTDWNARYETGDTPWEKGEAAPPLLEALGKLGAEIWGDGPVLVPGCGSGHDVRALAASGLPSVGVDLAPLAIAAAESHPKAGAETYELADFLHPGWQEGRSFSALWEHTCFCAIDPSRRDDYARACANLIAPGGRLIGVFFLTPQGPGEENQGPPFNSTATEIEARFAEWFDREHGWIPERAYPGREGKEWVAVFRRK
ncbi:methyltransferase domain-containing protein [Akkermansiaceae bacterium]|nr:methyltransferase domain-containing protein [Akkermansiaceae bacterium]